MKKNKSNYTPSLLGSIQVLAILLKLFKIVNIPWWLVFSPTYFAVLSTSVLMTLIIVSDKKMIKREKVLKEESEEKKHDKELVLSNEHKIENVKVEIKSEKEQLKELRNMYIKDDKKEKNKVKELTR